MTIFRSGRPPLKPFFDHFSSSLALGIMLFATILVLPLVYSSDVIRFDFWDSPEISKTDFVPVKNEIVSDFGVFVDRRPKFLTERNQTYRRSYIQKIPKNQDGGRKRINTLLKDYLTKLYTQKFSGGNKNLTSQYESKFFDDSFGQLKNKTKSFTNKFLSLFHIVQFANSQCQSSSSFGDYLGTCYHETECAAMNGTNFGDCAEGYGVCCVCK